MRYSLQDLSRDHLHKQLDEIENFLTMDNEPVVSVSEKGLTFLGLPTGSDLKKMLVSEAKSFETAFNKVRKSALKHKPRIGFIYELGLTYFEICRKSCLEVLHSKYPQHHKWIQYQGQKIKSFFDLRATLVCLEVLASFREKAIQNPTPINIDSYAAACAALSTRSIDQSCALALYHQEQQKNAQSGKKDDDLDKLLLKAFELCKNDGKLDPKEKDIIAKLRWLKKNKHENLIQAFVLPGKSIKISATKKIHTNTTKKTHVILSREIHGSYVASLPDRLNHLIKRFSH